MLSGEGGARPPEAWMTAVAPDLPRLDLDSLFAVVTRDYSPDFLSPPPSRPVTDIAGDLARVRGAPAGQVEQELRQLLIRQPGRRRAADVLAMLRDPLAARDRLADLVESAWQVLVAPWWPRLRDVLETDVAFQGRRLADAGIAALFASFRPHLRWDGEALRIPLRAASFERSLDGRGLLLMPAVFHHVGVGLMIDPPWQPTLIYAARGAGTVWQPVSGERPALVALLGRTRAAVLDGLAEPTSTSGLARRCGVPISSTSEHLTVLRNAGLVSTRRTGRTLTHRRTALGKALVAREDV
jgi:DNA-binding transcriptional ArsR family regulator